jgi:hypothetical protein
VEQSQLNTVRDWLLLISRFKITFRSQSLTDFDRIGERNITFLSRFLPLPKRHHQEHSLGSFFCGESRSRYQDTYLQMHSKCTMKQRRKRVESFEWHEIVQLEEMSPDSLALIDTIKNRTTITNHHPGVTTSSITRCQACQVSLTAQ